jgi:hypothetical protein
MNTPEPAGPPEITLCYLCGEQLAEPINRDHVPPKQLYAKQLRQKHTELQLQVLPVHQSCNAGYSRDEDYFVNTLLPFAAGSYSGSARLQQAFTNFRGEKDVLLLRKVLREFEREPSGIVLPPGKVAKRFEGARVRRVALKIVRGLYFIHFGTPLPELLTAHVDVIPPGKKPPDHFLLAMGDQPSLGTHQGVFAYKWRTLPEVNDAHYWSLLLWDQIILIIMFHNPLCQCAGCLK